MIKDQHKLKKGNLGKSTGLTSERRTGDCCNAQATHYPSDIVFILILIMVMIKATYQKDNAKLREALQAYDPFPTRYKELLFPRTEEKRRQVCQKNDIFALR